MQNQLISHPHLHAVRSDSEGQKSWSKVSSFNSQEEGITDTSEEASWSRGATNEEKSEGKWGHWNFSFTWHLLAVWTVWQVQPPFNFSFCCFEGLMWLHSMSFWSHKLSFSTLSISDTFQFFIIPEPKESHKLRKCFYVGVPKLTCSPTRPASLLSSCLSDFMDIPLDSCASTAACIFLFLLILTTYLKALC